MAGTFAGIFEQEFAAQSVIVVTHSLAREDLFIRVVIGDVSRPDLVVSTIPDFADPLNKLTITLSSPQTGRVQLLVTDLISATLPTAAQKARMEDNRRAPLFGTLEGARLERVNNAQVQVLAGLVADSTRTAIIEWSGTLNVNITSSGAGGLDTGSEAASTWYAVHVIGDTSGVNAPAGMLSVSATAPTLPSGYDVFRRVGWVRNPANSNFLRFRQTGNGRDRWTDWDANNAQYVISGGSVDVWTNVSAAAYVPPTSNRCLIVFYLDTGAAGSDNYLNLRPGNGTRDFHDFHSPGVATNGDWYTTQAQLFLDDSQTFDYAISPVDGSAWISLRGFEDQL